MPKFIWSEKHSVFVPEIDTEHQLIFRLCRDLQCAVAGRAPDDEIESKFNELAIHMLEHFWHEERRMRAAGYIHYIWHKQQHHTARTRMKVFEGRIRGGDHEAAGALLVFMYIWLNDHIRLTDRMLGAYLRNRQREMYARAS
jgi:hemerythrin